MRRPWSQKWAIRIGNSNGLLIEKRLFAIVTEENLTKYYHMAKKTIPSGSSEWVEIDHWN